MLKVKNIWGPTIQGEGRQVGLAAIFIRFAGCNIWDGREETRNGNPCYYCDTDFRGGKFMSAEQIVTQCDRLRGSHNLYLAVLTGGEPLLQNSKELVLLLTLLRDHGYVTQMETNGTQWNEEVIRRLDFLTVSPKRPRRELKVDWGEVDCLKLLYPHKTVKVEDFRDLGSNPNFRNQLDCCVQPIQEGNDAQWDFNTKEAVALVKSWGYPWRISLQTHKLLGEE